MTQDKLKKTKYVEMEGNAASQDELQEAIKRTQKDNRPMNYYSRDFSMLMEKLLLLLLTTKLNRLKM